MRSIWRIMFPGRIRSVLQMWASFCNDLLILIIHTFDCWIAVLHWPFNAFDYWIAIIYMHFLFNGRILDLSLTGLLFWNTPNSLLWLFRFLQSAKKQACMLSAKIDMSSYLRTLKRDTEPMWRNLIRTLTSINKSRHVKFVCCLIAVSPASEMNVWILALNNVRIIWFSFSKLYLLENRRLCMGHLECCQTSMFVSTFLYINKMEPFDLIYVLSPFR